MSEINMGFGILGCTYDNFMSQQFNFFNFLPILQCTQNSKSDIISTYILIETHFDISPHLIIIGVNVILNIDNYSHWIIALIYL